MITDRNGCNNGLQGGGVHGVDAAPGRTPQAPAQCRQYVVAFYRGKFRGYPSLVYPLGHRGIYSRLGISFEN